MVVVTLQIISLVALFGPMTAFGDIVTGEPDELTGAVVGGWSASFGASLLVSWLAGVLLSGMLTGRSSCRRSSWPPSCRRSVHFSM